jgi:phosphatidate cytidylyltransferase
MSESTVKRIVSAIILIMIFAICLWLGQDYTYVLLLVTAFLAIDEILINFVKLPSRTSGTYITGQLIALFPLIAYYSVLKFSNVSLKEFLLHIGALINVFFVMYLFGFDLKKSKIIGPFIHNKIFTGLLLSLPMTSLIYILFNENWLILLCFILVVNFSMDTGAWFFGKQFGRHKLWPEVSPNKTVEGLVGGALTSAFLGSIFYYMTLGTPDFILFLLMGLLGGMSQIGDLCQSKLKRQYGVKDSSNLIPGHGGVYDRIDSLIFLSPFFALALKYLNT